MSTSLPDFLAAQNSIYLEQMLEKYLTDPDNVDQEWKNYFNALRDTQPELLRYPNWGARRPAVVGVADSASDPEKAKAHNISYQTVSSAEIATLKFLRLVKAYRERGHLLAKLDPLGLEQPSNKVKEKLTSENFDITTAELKMKLGAKAGHFAGMVLGDAINYIEQVYSSSIGVEVAHISNFDEQNWLETKFEGKEFWKEFSNSDKSSFYRHISEAEFFEQLLHKKFRGDKRFSVEGGETSILSLEVLIDHTLHSGIQEMVIGMAHRGRLNTLTKVMGKPYEAMISEFKGNKPFPDDMDIAGDVKYHMGHSSDRVTEGKKLHLSLMCNPSHLETVDPLVAGKVRSIQDLLGDKDRNKVMGVLIHGDAAFSGQGVVPETLTLSELEGYKTGGTFHLVINNQVGFTTDYVKARKSRYPTEVAKIVQAPIFHVNGDDPEAVARVTKLAAEYRKTFQKDVVINLVCYRKYGHNEGDEPNFTQPIMYQTISNHQAAPQAYGKKLVASGVFSQEEKDKTDAEFNTKLEEAYRKSESYKPKEADWLKGRWQKCSADFSNTKAKTGLEVKKLASLVNKLSKIPEGFDLHPKIIRLLEAKQEAVSSGNKIDWATGEAMAFASLLDEGFRVRLAGQDAGRGTFSHRHSVWRDQKTGAEYIPFNHLSEKQGVYEVVDSFLSEYAALGFEYGYALAHPDQLVIWEAQFGDFSNGGQIVIDQYISSAETKWLRMNGLVMLLPHAFEGMGPEHSSARLERYLQLCAEDNMQVAYPTTPASIFHLLRRQLHRPFRKPLIVMSPKSVLRHPLATSKLSEFDEGTSFKAVLGETAELVEDGAIETVIMCSGKVYYDLVEAREKAGINNKAILRLEQLYPFPEAELLQELARYPKAKFVWCQEEPQNMGACTFIAGRLKKTVDQLSNKDKHISYAGRKEAASPATGYKKVHEEEQKAFIAKALSY